MSEATPPYVLGDIPMGDFLEAKMDFLRERGKHLIYRKIFSLEGALLNKEFPPTTKSLKGILELLSWYRTIEEEPPGDVAEALEEAKSEIKKEVVSHSKHLELIENGFISHRLVRKMRFESGMSDFEVLQLIHRCQKEGKTFENPRGTVKYLDPRLRKLY